MEADFQTLHWLLIAAGAFIAAGILAFRKEGDK